MKCDVLIMPEAYAALSENAVWWAENRSRDEAIRWYETFLARLKGIGEMPQSYPLAAEDHIFAFELREMLFCLGRRPTHRALFRITGSTVEVLTIRHVAQRDLGPDDLT
jgi:plasmid stabilization system protein ParE